MVGLKATELTGEERNIFRDGAFGGFILYQHNLSDPEQIVGLCRSLWDFPAEHPPFIAIDEEGGRVHRLPEPFTRFPAAALIGRNNDPDLAYRLGRAGAEELTLAGINLNFAPVLDVNSNPENPVIGDRSFASDPVRVIRLSNSWMQGLRDGGIIPCVKHFPGHGATDRDSHFMLPVMDRSLQELAAVELRPFIHACRNKVETLMTAHVLYPALDAHFPATLSHAIVTGFLRQQLGYEGVVFSDDMEMKAITDHYSHGIPSVCRVGDEEGVGLEEAALIAVRAGIDVLLYGHELPRALEAFELLCLEAERHAEIRAQVEKSYPRIVNLKRRFLKRFAGITGGSLATRLAGLRHEKWVNELTASGRRCS